MTDQVTDAPEGVVEEPILTPEAQDNPAPEGAETGDQPAAETIDEPAKPAKKTFQERMDEKTRLQREAERERDALRDEVERLRAARENPPEPDDEDYIDQIVERRLAARDEAHKAQQAHQTWIDRQAKAAEKHEDYFEAVVEGADKGAWVCTPDMAEAIKESEQGAEVAYHLAKNPDEARRIAGLSPYSQIRELGRIEAGLTGAAAPKSNPVTAAPEPPPQARGAGGKFKVAADTSDFAAFEAQHMAGRS